LSSLDSDVLDFKPNSVESYISVPGSVAAGWTDVGKAYLRFDDEDVNVRHCTQGSEGSQ
jgi:hypothetical protein